MPEAARQQAARVFARLLAGEIRLYNEEAVVVGRLRGDLAERLAGPVEQARRRYLARYGDVDPSLSLLEAEIAGALGGKGSTLTH